MLDQVPRDGFLRFTGFLFSQVCGAVRMFPLLFLCRPGACQKHCRATREVVRKNAIRHMHVSTRCSVCITFAFPNPCRPSSETVAGRIRRLADGSKEVVLSRELCQV